MKKNYDEFIAGINEKKLIEVTFDSNEKGCITRICAPFDFGPSRRNLSQNPDRFHLYDLNSPDGEHTLSILPEQLISIKRLEQSFNPAEIITWPWPPKHSPHWFISRDWGIYS